MNHMHRIYFYKNDALVADEKKRQFFFTTKAAANEISNDKIISVQPKYSLHNQADLLLELGYEKIKSDA